MGPVDPQLCVNYPSSAGQYFSMELEGRGGRGTREQREEERGGGIEGDKEAERLPFISETYFLHYNMQTKTVLGSGLIFKIY